MPERIAGLVGAGIVLWMGFASPIAAQIVTTGPPPGFADVNTAQPAVVDLWYDGSPLGTADVLVRPGFVRFDDPSAVADLLPGEVDREAVASALTGELASHADRVCGAVPAPDCGVLVPNAAGVIFDAATFRLDLFVSSDLRSLQDGEAVFFTPPGWQPSAVQSFDVAASIVPGETTQAVLSGRSIVASGPTRLLADYGLDVDTGFFTNTLLGQAEIRAWRVEGGLGRASPIPVLGSRPFVGARLATTLDTRRDRDSVRGSSLVVTLSRRSQVQVFRDGRLLTAQSLPAGTQLVDTSALPVGSYDIEVRIVSPAGVREETRFFVKSIDLPPVGAPQFLVEAGVFADDEQAPWPALGDRPFLHGGARYRVTDSLGIGVDLAGMSDAIAGSGEAFALWRGVELGLSGFVTSDAAFGGALAVRGLLGNLSYGLAARRTSGDAGPGRIDRRGTDDDGDDVFVADDRLDRLTGSIGDSTQFDVNLGYGFANGARLGFRGFWSDDGVDGATYSFGPNLYWPLGTLGATRVDLLADAATNNDESFVLARLRLAFASGRWRLDGTAGYRHSDRGSADDGFQGGVALGRSWQRDGRGRVQALLRADQVAGDTSFGASVDAEGPPGSMLVSVDRDLDADGVQLALTGRTVALASGGGVGISGTDAQTSALVLAVEGEGDAVFEALVDERPRGQVAAGDRLVLPLPSFESYRVRLRQTDGAIVAYDGETRERTLYPGTVATELWRVQPLVSVFGRLLDHDGEPLVDATLLTEPRYVTDGAGYFQADLGVDVDGVEVSADGRRCRAALPALRATSTYQRVGDVRCVTGGGSSALSR